MRSSRFMVAAAIVPLALLTACGDDGGQAKTSSSSSTSSAAGSSSSASPASSGASSAKGTPLTVPSGQVAPITAATVGLANPAKPTLTLTKKPFQVNASTTKVLKEGTGKVVGNKDIVYTSYVAANGTSGKTIESTFGKPSAAFNLGNPGTFPGLVKAFKGKKVGTEMVVAVPPAEGFGATGRPEVGVTNKDTLVFYVKLNDTTPLLQKAQGAAVTPPAGLPTVKIADAPNAQATITVPKGAAAPTSLVKQVLVQGTGPKVVAGHSLLVTYTGALYSNGTVFDASAKQGQPANFQIGTGRVIKAWDQALVGQQVGSRVLIVAPADLAYGKDGQKGPDGKQVIPPNAPLVFVVDILAAL